MKRDLRSHPGLGRIARLASASLLLSLAPLAGCEQQPSTAGGAMSESSPTEGSAGPGGTPAHPGGGLARKGKARVPSGGRLEREQLRKQGVDPGGQPATR
jgi:hypothetical protein